MARSKDNILKMINIKFILSYYYKQKQKLTRPQKSVKMQNFFFIIDTSINYCLLIPFRSLISWIWHWWDWRLTCENKRESESLYTTFRKRSINILNRYKIDVDLLSIFEKLHSWKWHPKPMKFIHNWYKFVLRRLYEPRFISFSHSLQAKQHRRFRWCSVYATTVCFICDPSKN